MAVRSTNTVSELLQGVVQDLASGLMMPDAQNPEMVEFLTDLMAQITEMVTKPYRTSQLPPSDASGMPMGGMRSPMMGGAPGGGPPMGPPPGGMPGGAPGMPGPGPAGPTPPRPLAGVTSGTPMPNPDELRRILGTGAR